VRVASGNVVKAAVTPSGFVDIWAPENETDALGAYDTLCSLVQARLNVAAV
jgi:hypothetical protein